MFFYVGPLTRCSRLTALLTLLLASGFPAQAQTRQVTATVETAPVPSSGDAADDAAVWIHPSDTSQSLILGTDKRGGLAVYNLQGAQLQYDTSAEPNNVDVRYNFPLGGDSVALVAFSDESFKGIGVYKVNPATRSVVNVAAREIETVSAYGFCLYHSPLSGKVYGFVTSSSGVVEQWELFDNGSGKVDGALRRSFDVGDQVEGCVADDEYAVVYFGEEDFAIWRYGAEPGDGTARVQVDSVASGRLEDDIEGLTIYYASNGAGYLIASSQGASEFVIYRRAAPNAYVMTFEVITGNGIDDVSGTDGIDVTNFPLGPTFPAGAFIAQDGGNSNAGNGNGGNQNFKLVHWQDIANSVSPPLLIDTTWDPRRVGGEANLAPFVDAGLDTSITLPTNQVVLDGTISDDGLPSPPALTSNWTQIGGAGVGFSNAASVDTTATFPGAGTFVLQLQASDGELSANDQVTVTVHPEPPPNTAPVVSASTTSPVTQPAPVFLDGTVNDDGLPSPPALSTTWSLVSGPGAVSFANAAAQDTTATFSAPGAYVLRLLGSDGALSASADVSVDVAPAPNSAPSVAASTPTPVVTLPAAATLDGTIADDGWPAPPGAVTRAWSQVSGPGTASFANAAATDTTASFSAPGDYLLRLTASDSQLESFAEVAVTVLAAPPPPQTIFLDDFPQTGAFTQWVESNETDWTIKAPEEKAVPGVPGGNLVGHAESCTSSAGCLLTLTQPLDLSFYTSATLSFWRYVDLDLDSGEFLRVEISNGATWTTIFNWTHGVGDDDQWHQETYAIPASHRVSGFYLRFISKSSSSDEDTEIDAVRIEGIAGNQPPLASAGPDQSVVDSDGSGFELVTLDGSASSDPNGVIASYAWREGTTVLGTAAALLADLAVGVHTLTLTVVDDDGASTSDPVVVTVLPQAGPADFRTQVVKLTIPAGATSASATAPAAFAPVDPAHTLALVSGVTQHAMGWTAQTSQGPNAISARVVLGSGTTLTATRASAFNQSDTVWVLLIEYVGPAGGPNELVVRDRRVHTWSSSATSASYGPIATVVNRARAVVFSGGASNSNSSSAEYDRSDVRAYLDSAGLVQLRRGQGGTAAASAHQVVELVGSNWTVQSGDASPAPRPGGTNVTLPVAVDPNRAFVYFTWSTNDGSLDERGHRLWLTGPSTLRVEEDTNGNATKTVRWYVLSNPELNVQTGAADLAFSGNTAATISGFTPVADLGRSFAWVAGETDGSASSAHPRDMWQFELANPTSISLLRGYSGQELSYRYFVVELP